MKYNLKNWEKDLISKKIYGDKDETLSLNKDELPAFFQVSNEYGRIEANVFSTLLTEFGIYVLEDWNTDEINLTNSTGEYLTENQSNEKCKEIRKASQLSFHLERAKSGNGFISITLNTEATKNNAKIHAEIKKTIESPLFDKVSNQRKVDLINKGCERANESIVGKSTQEIHEMVIEALAFYDKLKKYVDSLTTEKEKKKHVKVSELKDELISAKPPKKAKIKITKKDKKQEKLKEIFGFEDPRAAFEQYLASQKASGKADSIETVKTEERNYNS